MSEKPRGRAIEWDDETLDGMTEAAAMLRAQAEAAAWAEDRAPALAELLDAAEDDG